MKKRIRYLISNTINKWFNPIYKIDTVNVGNRELKLYRGTFKGVDKDDAWYAYLVKDSSVIFDIGANIGWTALLANIYGKPRRVVLVDPNPLALTYAAGNLIMNGYSLGCTFVKRFISDEIGGEVKFYTIGTGAAGSIFGSHAKTASSLNSWFWVPTSTVDELSSTLQLAPDLIKIDVEGAEHMVLLGAKEVAGLRNLRIFIEMHSNSELSMEENCRRILEWSRHMGYTMWYLKDAIEIKSPEQIKHRGRCHVILLKNGIDYPIELKGIKQGDGLPNTNPA